jgi:hypothetical protein
MLLFLLPMAAAVVGATWSPARPSSAPCARSCCARSPARLPARSVKWVVAVLYLLVGLLLVVVQRHPLRLALLRPRAAGHVSGTTVSVAEGIGLILLMALFALAAMSCIISLALLFSTLTDSSLTALIATIVVYIVIQVLIVFSTSTGCGPTSSPSTSMEYVNLLQRPDRLAADPGGAPRLRPLERRPHGRGVAALPPQGRALVSGALQADGTAPMGGGAAPGATSRRPLPLLVKAALAAFLAAEALVLLIVGDAALVLVGGWALVAVLVALGARAVRSPLARAVACGVLLPVCLLLALLGGLLVLPAAVLLFFAAYREWLMSRQEPGA